MKCKPLAVLGALLLAAGSSALAQIQVAAQTERSNFLLYERVDLLVTVTNTTDTDIDLNNTEGHPWLSFLVTTPNGLPVHSERQSNFSPLTLKGGETKTLRINLTPLFAFRQEGNYLASAVIDLPGADQITSQSVPFNVVHGRQVWSQTRTVDGAERVYSLIRFSPKVDSTHLYLRVEEPAENVVDANLSLGEIVSYVDPDVFFDPAGNIHILQPIAMGTYLYSRADVEGKVVHQAIFKTFHDIPPRLSKIEDGNVIVVGGLEENPNMPRERLHDAQGVQKVEAPTGGSMQ
ncbi:MAG: hypothetical protein LV479_04650 [Methylacidiphilales bacterium]|nr:hypothetical protein [Candidatus Methylacidiphilales bacterium]